MSVRGPLAWYHRCHFSGSSSICPQWLRQHAPWYRRCGGASDQRSARTLRRHHTQRAQRWWNFSARVSSSAGRYTPPNHLNRARVRRGGEGVRNPKACVPFGGGGGLQFSSGPPRRGQCMTAGGRRATGGGWCISGGGWCITMAVGA